MATLIDLEDDTKAALAAIGLTVYDAPTRNEQRVVRGVQAAFVTITRGEEVNPTSNRPQVIAEVSARIANRATGSTIAELEADHDGLISIMDQLIAISFWSVLPSVFASPLPEIEIEEEPNRTGEVLTFVIRARCVLEA